MTGAKPQRRWPVRRFLVVEQSMLPALAPGDGVLAVRCGVVRSGQVRVFPDPGLPSRWLIKRVGAVHRGGAFDAVSDNADAAGVVDSRQFGPVPVAGSYVVVWTVRSGPPGPGRRAGSMR
ncbi:S26 family signal peptidase [Mycolicibacterium murale]|nr:S26 family signal peptidase [Mycolicibacterium murale]